MDLFDEAYSYKTYPKRFRTYQSKTAMRGQKFRHNLYHLSDYLTRRHANLEPEEKDIRSILIELVYILEEDLLEAMRKYPQKTDKEKKFLEKAMDGDQAFKNICDWCLSRSVITQKDMGSLKEVRELRNFFAHNKQPPGRRRARKKYKNFPLLTLKSLQRLFNDCDLLHQKLNPKETWPIIPHGYAEEMWQ